MIQLGPLTLGTRPHLVAAVSDDVAERDAESAVAAGVDLFELRIDQFSSAAPDDVRQVSQRLRPAPLLATIRVAAEGGAWARDEQARLALFTAILPHVDAVDVELSAKEILPEVVEAAHAAGRLVIGSYHNFEATPIPEKLAGFTNDAKLLGVDIVKVAAYCNTQVDVQTLARFTVEHAAKHLITIGMGPHGMLTRLFFPALGSLLTYTYLGAATAPGQLTCSQTIQYLTDFYPDFRQEDVSSGESQTPTV
ncbi:MAG: type I 3-dehydroquinate dehydratase [Candidatus Hydrogenedentes bacterium]|nr:type I 3-dehydroquinate dehydratase [Candidatus Hydrogenedentota bacterium]MBI3119218.1 type I 3-dehydroquinate dehydratase [Candidatus Hydrogenedentota bacterium]